MEQLKRANKLHDEQGLHALATLRVPVPRHGALYNTPTEFADLAETTTHTTRRLRGPVAEAPAPTAPSMLAGEDPAEAAAAVYVSYVSLLCRGLCVYVSFFFIGRQRHPQGLS